MLRGFRVREKLAFGAVCAGVVAKCLVLVTERQGWDVPLCFPTGLIIAQLTFLGRRDTVFMYL